MPFCLETTEVFWLGVVFGGDKGDKASSLDDGYGRARKLYYNVTFLEAITFTRTNLHAPPPDLQS